MGAADPAKARRPASAAFKNGVLTVTVPKSAEAKTNVRRIAINRNG
jgi:HSP20 family protein